MDDTDLDTLKAIEKNGVAHSVYWCHWPKMKVVEHPHAVVTESELPCPFFNNVFSADIPQAKVETVVDDLIGRFRSRNVPCFWWSGPANHDQRITGFLEERGFEKAFEAAAMALSLADLPTGQSGVAEVIEIESEGQMADWSRICTAAFGFDDALSGWWHELFTSIPFGGMTQLHHFLATVDGEPVGTASAFIEDGVVGLATVGVREEHRRRGIGTVLTLTALEATRRLGCRLGVLFSSPMATSMYEAMGFHRYGTGRCYSWSPQADEIQTRSWA
jgi:GNAT superfamily N-acetyltransferase